LNTECFIQNYVDHDPSSAYRDYRCGHLTYDGHGGTDFRLRDLPAMIAGVPVLAAAEGKVVGVRDGEPDISVNERGRSNLHGKDAGNGVRIDHGNGWETQYSHLRQGSVRVSVGNRVAAGTELGLVGLSGRTEFPHLDFVVRYRGQIVDPFAVAGNSCSDAADSLWAPAVGAATAYRAGALLIAGFAAEAPERSAAEAGRYSQIELSPQSPLVSYWVEIFGALPGDEWSLMLSDGQGKILGEQRGKIDRPKAVWFGYVGKQRGETPWTGGSFNGEFKLLREGVTVMKAERKIEMPGRKR
jgi:hypothetical protein